MKYKIFLIATIMMVLMFPNSASAYDFSAVTPTGQTLYYDIINGNAQVAKCPYNQYYSGLTGALTIPPSVVNNGTTYNVTSIGNGAFQSQWFLTSVSIPDCVTYIGKGAFTDCRGLTSITIPENVTYIGDGAFSWCNSLTAVEFNAINCTTMGSEIHRVFGDSPNIATITIGDNVTTIPAYAFGGWHVTSIILPNSVTSIGDHAFSGCHCLNTINIPNAVTTIGMYAFAGCRLTTIVIPNSVTFIDGNAFEYCSNLTSITSLDTVPPQLWYNVFSHVPNGIPLYVPCGSENNYSSSAWNYFSNIICFTDPTITVTINATTGGTVTGGGEAMIGEVVTIRALAEDGYKFTHWNDGDTSAQRTIVVFSDTSFTAHFESTTQGIYEADNNTITIYPNPTNGKVKVDSDDVTRIDVYNVNGQLVKSVSKDSVIDISNLPSGAYTLRVMTVQSTFVCRVIKQ